MSPWRKRLEDLDVPCRFAMRPETTPMPASVTATPTCNESRVTVQYRYDPHIRFNIRKYVHKGLTHDRSSLSGDDPHRYRCRAAAGGINALMFVCLCTGATRHVVADVVAGGACTSKQVAEACGAGADCGRCRRTVRAIIAAAAQVNAGAAC